MNNPFEVASALSCPELLIGQADQMRGLDMRVKNHADAVLMGPEGSGKASLLQCRFTVEFRRQMAQQGILIYLGQFPKSLPGDDIYGLFADGIRTSVTMLSSWGRKEDAQALLDSMNSVAYASELSRFENYLSLLQGMSYHMVFVLNNFENFLLSPDINATHHDLLRDMLDNSKMSMIVATHYDFNKTSLPKAIHSSTLLSRLSPNKIRLSPLSQEECRLFLEQKFSEAGQALTWTQEQVAFLYDLSGGIPRLLNTAAEQLFEALDMEEEDWRSATATAALESLRTLFAQWCKLLPQEQIAVLTGGTDDRGILLIKDGHASALETRGLLQKDFIVTRSGRRKDTGEGYRYNSKLFAEFCKHPQWLAEAAGSNPLHMPVQQTPLAPLASISEKGLAGMKVGTLIISEGPVTMNQDHSVHTTTIIASRGLELLYGLKGMLPEDIQATLLDSFNATPCRTDIVDGELVEQNAERIVSMFIPEEVEAGDPEAIQKEQQTLQEKFQAVRSKVDPNHYLTDSLLNSLSEKCRLYLQIAFVVDDTLSVLENFHLGDLSAQMVMYGKVLEQHLRDCFYSLFQNDVYLMHYDTFAESINRSSKKIFARYTEKDTSIGNYWNMLRLKPDRMAALCHQQQTALDGCIPDGPWWTTLSRDVAAAGSLRNSSDHAGSETDKAKLVQMRESLFGPGVILRRCAVSQQLEPISPPKLVGQTVTLTDLSSTQRGGLRGTIDGTALRATIPANQISTHGIDCTHMQGKSLQVELFRWIEAQKNFLANIV